MKYWGKYLKKKKKKKRKTEGKIKKKKKKKKDDNSFSSLTAKILFLFNTEQFRKMQIVIFSLFDTN